MSKVTLVGITKPLIEGVESAEELIAYAARVSNPANQHNMDTAPKLLKYLISNNHWSPLEMVSATMEIETTRDIARQILRHRSFSFQEFSQRYARADQLDFQYREARLQDNKNRQNSIETDDRELANEWLDRQARLLVQIKEDYNWALSNGIAKEQARAVLPEGITGSRLYMAGTIRSWVHYIQLRRANGTQKEHQIIALQAEAELVKHFPSLSFIFGDQ
ncbi:THY1 Predicted alternative thymidylate synthase [uncultured Caudovirales phage]|uniref:THY1 Predicted alternative thymidylate synthase n=1 Tax=uncultured Caudovirales phage TaxID=2100421 RepID=A0A6J5LMY3_9CAUD|nr:THY1 Predicted alternative thymidylate synthase [uncultured Caudovirales phage]